MTTIHCHSLNLAEREDCKGGWGVDECKSGFVDISNTNKMKRANNYRVHLMMIKWRAGFEKMGLQKLKLFSAKDENKSERGKTFLDVEL